MEKVKNKRKRGYTRISSKHQITIPARALEEAGLGPGDELKVEVDRAGRVVLSAADETTGRRESITKTAGALTGVYGPGYLEKLRDEWR